MGFKPKEDTALRLARQQEVTFSKERFVEDVFNDEYLLVVGSEVIMDKQLEPTGDVNQYILNAVNSSLGRRYHDFNELIRQSAGGVDAIRNLLTSEDDFTYELDDTDPALRQLLSTQLFPLVLTTTFDGYLETIMRDVWGNRLRVVNIDDKKSMDDFRNTLAGCRNGQQYRQPTLLYIFGKAVKDEARKFVRTDNDAIQIVEKWIQLSKDDPVMQLIRSKRLLALGCKFDDWYFRFFWYILKRDISRLGAGEVAITLDETDSSQQRLKKFLTDTRIYTHGDARRFMADITQMLTSTDASNPFSQHILRHRRRGGVFISYYSHDFILASQLFFMLTRRGFNVWFDNERLRGGDNYNTEIEQAIGEARVFVPLLTPHIATDLAAGRTDNYYNKEWRMAAQLPGKRLLPLAANGYDLRACYHTDVFESIVADSLSGLDLMQPDGFTKFIQTLTENL